jgi:hypothetical protein
MAETLMDLACEQRAALVWAFRGVELIDRLDAGVATSAEKSALRVLTPLLKYYLAKRAVWAASEAMEALGGNGYIEDWPTARLLRDAQVLPIWEGTTHVLTLDAFRALRKEGPAAYFAELEPLAAQAPPDLEARLAPMLDELFTASAELSAGGRAEHALRDWTDRACLLWQGGLLCAESAGAGTDSDLRAARRLLARNAPLGLLRADRAGPDEVALVAHA